MDTRICCCGAESLTKSIGWFQTVGSVIAVFALTFFICLLAQITDEDLLTRAFDQGLLTAREVSMMKSTFTAQCIFVALVLVFAIVSFIMGNILLRGTYTRNTRFLRAWIIFTLISTTVGFLLTLAKWIFFSSSAFVPELLFLLFLLTLGAMGIYIVQTHKHDLEDTC